jgi:DNA-binding beta-propeller fold protein YncE
MEKELRQLHELAPGSMLQRRYKIKKTLTSSAREVVYVAHDQNITDRMVVVREMVSGDNLDHETYQQRRQMFSAAVEAIMLFEHPALTHVLDQFEEARNLYVVEEFVEGLTLQAIASMSARAIPEKDIIDWAMQLCAALMYLQERPRPFMFWALSPDHVMLDADGRHVRLFNYGLDAYFDETPPPAAFSESADEAVQLLPRLGETLAFLVLKEVPSPFGLPAQVNATAELAAVINRLLKKDFKTLAEVQSALDAVLHPVAPAKKPDGARALPPIPSAIEDVPSWDERIIDVLGRFLSQPKWLLGIEAIVVVGAMVGWFLATHSLASFSRAGSVVYVVRGSEILAIDAASPLNARGKPAVLDRLQMDGRAGDVATDPSGSYLFVAAAGTRNVYRYDTHNDQLPQKGGIIKVDDNPTTLLADPVSPVLYASHPKDGNISHIDLNRQFPVINYFLIASRGATSLAVSPSGKLLAVGNPTDNSVSVYLVDSNKFLFCASLQSSPNAMAFSPDESAVWVACKDLVAVVGVKAQAVQNIYTDVGGSGSTAITCSADGTRVFVANVNPPKLVALDASSGKPQGSVALGAAPLRMQPYSSALWISTANGITVVDPAGLQKKFEVPIDGLTGPLAIAR